jgi:N-methylhydantoinase B
MYDYGGGGGWGEPLDRDPQAVLDDVLDEYVSVEGAARIQGELLLPPVPPAVAMDLHRRV